MALTTTRYFRWDDPGAPALNGTKGSGIAWLKALLVGDINGVAYGTGANEKKAAGWTVEYEDALSNICVFRNSLAAGGTGCYLRVDDNGIGTGGTREMLVRLYGSMSGASTGTDQTPTAAAQAASVVWRKSISTDNAGREWILGADERTVSFCVFPGWLQSGVKWGHIIGHAGDYESSDPAQPFPCVIAGSDMQSNSPSFGSGRLGIMRHVGNLSHNGIWVMRGVSYTSVPVSVEFNGTLLPLSSGSAVGGASSRIVAAAPGSGNRYFYPMDLWDGSTLLGRLRGLMAPVNDMTAFEMGDSIPYAVGGLAALIHQASINASLPSRGVLAIGTDVPW